MALRALTRGGLTGIAVLAFSLALLAALALVSVVEDAQGRFANYAVWLFGFALLGVIALMGLIGLQLGRLSGERKNKIAGSALATRLARNFALIALPPILLVFAFSLNFLARSVDQWFDLKTETALSDALQVSRDLIANQTQTMNRSLDLVQKSLQSGESAQEVFEQSIDQNEFAQLALFGLNGNLIATSAADPRWLFPQAPDADTMLRVQASGSDTNTLPEADGLALRAIRYRPNAPDGGVFLQAVQVLPPVLGVRTRNIETSFNDYQRLKFLRGALKSSFILVLVVVVLLALLIALLAALAAARRLALPIAQLAEATSEIARGNLKIRLQNNTQDELGQLANSFNQMTAELDAAQQRERETQNLIETNRAYLETVLQQITSGVVSLDCAGNLVTANEAAKQRLGLDQINRDSLRALNTEDNRFAALISLLLQRALEQRGAWLEEIVIQSIDHSPQILLVRGDNLPNGAGLVAIFDDMTKVAQAQREAAWSEVAKRLAHEIKNPLTPIQLAAERLQYKLADKLSSSERELLEKGTRTIVAQVDTLKNLVNAFGDYALSPKLRFKILDLHHLVNEVLDLFESDSRADIVRELSAETSMVRADPDRIRQLLNNILKNALEASPTQSSVKITARSQLSTDQNSIELIIHDDGPGLPNDFDQTWFEPYRTNKPKGTGLGLSIVQKIADEHNGQIHAKNHLAGGAQFILTLTLIKKTENGSR